MTFTITKAFILEGLNVILKFNYFYIKKNVFHQIKGMAMATIFAVVSSNLTVAYFEICFITANLFLRFCRLFCP